MLSKAKITAFIASFMSSGIAMDVDSDDEFYKRPAAAKTYAKKRPCSQPDSGDEELLLSVRA